MVGVLMLMKISFILLSNEDANTLYRLLCRKATIRTYVPDSLEVPHINMTIQLCNLPWNHKSR